MAQKKNTFNVEISDIFDEEQEEFVIQKVLPFLKQSAEELREQFKTTDTVEVRRMSEEEAKKLCSELEGRDLTVKMSDIKKRQTERAAEQIRCPKCGAVLEMLDWRCPECYHEFPEYEFVGDEDEQT
jgi:lipopolysaccharide biosynthesis regulator YciM